MFWRFGGYANISSLDSILDKQDVTVEELLDESDLIQELKQQNSKLVEFLRDEPALEKLLKYVTAEPPAAEEPKDKEKKADESSNAEDKHKSESQERERNSGISFFGRGTERSRSKSVNKQDLGETEQEKQEAQRKKYAYVACEVLSSEVWSITEAVLANREHLREFWQYIRRPAPLDPLQAGYFTKVNEALLDKKTEDMLAFFKSLEGIVPAMLQHVDCPMVMDLLLKIISLEKHEGGVGTVDWLQGQDLIPLLLGYLSPEHNSATQTSAGDFLKAIITISANATTQDQSVIGPNELTRQLVSDECISILIGDMLRGGNALTVGVGIIIEVIRKNNSDYDLDNQVGPEPKTSDPIYLGTLLRQFANHIPDFMELIRSKASKKPHLKAAFGGKVEPLGFDRFKTCELMAELLHCSNMGLLNERGADEEVRKRDEERERMKKAGRLATPKGPSSSSHEDQFGSSVDSHGFHHAEKPSMDELDEAPEEIKKLEVQNASDEDGFEKVAAPAADDLPDEVTFDDFSEKIEESDLPALRKVEKHTPGSSPTRAESADMPKPLSPTKAGSPSKQQLHFDPPPTQAADSPTTAGVTDRIGSMGMDEDTVMTELGEETSDPYDDDGPTELERELAKAERPAPLFARKEPLAADDVDPVHGGQSPDELQDVDRSIATLQGESTTLMEGDRTDIDAEDHGSPVVGDLLKLQFVEHQVVPTILDFFFRFPWNNFLHNVVYDVVQQVFNGALDRGYNRTLAFDLFRPVAEKDGKNAEALGFLSPKDITERILDGQAASEKSQQERNMRLGYMGHLTLIAEEVCKFGNRQPPDSLDPVVLQRTSRDEWIQYVEGTLAQTRDKDNAVLGGVRPENAMNRPMGGGGGMQSGFTSNTASTLANAGIGSNTTPADTLAMSEGTVGQAYEVNSGTILSGFGDGDDEDMEDHEEKEEQETKAAGGAGPSSAFSEDEQASDSPSTNSTSAAGVPPPLNIPPSRARRQLAARLAQRKKDAENVEHNPDAADAMALEAAHELPEEPDQMDLGPATERELREAGLQISGAAGGAGLRRGTASRFSGMFGSDDSSEEEDEEDGSEGSDEEIGGREKGVFGGGFDGAGVGRRASLKKSSKERRPSTTEAKERKPLDDDDDSEGEEGLSSHFDRGMMVSEGQGPFADPVDMEDEEDSDGEDFMEIKPRRASGT